MYAKILERILSERKMKSLGGDTFAEHCAKLEKTHDHHEEPVYQFVEELERVARELDLFESPEPLPSQPVTETQDAAL